jgi:hypothetical protein
VHLGERGTTRQGCGTKDCAKEGGSHGLLRRLDDIPGSKSQRGGLIA